MDSKEALTTQHPLSRLYLPGSDHCPLSFTGQADLSGTLGIGGFVSLLAEDFLVHELPKYPPSGSGEHTMAWVLKSARTTDEAVKALAAGSGVSPQDIGFAGRKDRDALTTQWFTIPVVPSDVRSCDDQVCILKAIPHKQKLKLGHNEGNLFTIRVREIAFPERLEEALERVSVGIPNYFGPQRFGRPFYRTRPDEGYHPPQDEYGKVLQDPNNPARDNIDRAFLLLDKASVTRGRGIRGKRKREDKLILSALQSALFNLWIGERIRDGLAQKVILGDVCRKTEGGTFYSQDPQLDTERLKRGEIFVLGPMIGPKLFPARDEALEREESLFYRWGITESHRATMAKSWRGDRRPLLLRPYHLHAQQETSSDGCHHVRLTFSLRSGSFATSILAALIDPQKPFRRVSMRSDSE